MKCAQYTNKNLDKTVLQNINNSKEKKKKEIFYRYNRYILL